MANTRFDAEWSLEAALELVRKLVHGLEIRGFAVGLTGSVLTRGRSFHDLDIIIYPLQNSLLTDFNDARNALRAAGMLLYLKSSTIKSVWKKKGLLDEKEVEVWLFKEKRVDVFFLK